MRNTLSSGFTVLMTSL